VLAGPTAVGKSALALKVAARVPATILSFDSRQIYRELEIGTAKPSREERRAVPHRGIDERSIDQPWTAGEAARDARVWLDQVWAAGRLPIVVGGSGLYLQAAFGGLDAGRSPPDPRVRERLEARHRAAGLEPLIEELRRRDPAALERIDRANPRRVLRALELLEAGAEAGGDLRRRRNRLGGPHFLLVLPRPELVRRIDARVEQMFEAGIVAETRGLVERWGEDALARLPTLGYDQVRAHLRGELPLAQAIEAVQVATRRFAKRQMTWFRKYGELEALDLSRPHAALDEVMARLDLPR